MDTDSPLGPLQDAVIYRLDHPPTGVSFTGITMCDEVPAATVPPYIVIGELEMMGYLPAADADPAEQVEAEEWSSSSHEQLSISMRNVFLFGMAAALLFVMGKMAASGPGTKP